MHVQSSSVAGEMRLAVEAAVEVTNDLADGGVNIQQLLVDKRYARAAAATADDIAQLRAAFAPVAEIVATLPETDLETAVAAINTELVARNVQPAVAAHDGGPLHIHWTRDDARFADQVVVDILMSLAQTICEDGLHRFGHCGAETCDDVFFDPTKNRSRRFCSDPKCASRTHTAEHRARQRDS